MIEEVDGRGLKKFIEEVDKRISLEDDLKPLARVALEEAGSRRESKTAKRPQAASPLGEVRPRKARSQSPRGSKRLIEENQRSSSKKLI